MSEFQTVLGAVVPIFVITGVGLIIRRLNWLTEEADQSLLRININLLMPCLILDKAIGNPALSEMRNLLLAPLVGFVTLGLGLFLAFASRPLHAITEAPARRTFAFSVGLYNYGYVPLPLALLLFDERTAGVLFVHNVGVEIGVWTLGVVILTGQRVGRDWRKIVNAPLVAIVLAIVFNAVGWHKFIPGLVLTGIHWLGECAVPMALILIGAIVADHLHEFHSASGWRVIGTAVLLRIGILPVLFLLAAKYLPASVELKRVMVLQAAMPAAVFPIILARHYGGNPPTAMRVVIGTSVIGLLTIPLWIRFGMHFVGL